MSISREFALGLTKAKEKKFELAIEHFSNAIEEDDTQVEYFAERAVAYIQIEKYELSLFDMNKTIELDPNYSYRYSCRAFLKARMGDLDGSIKDYQRAIELDPDDAIAYNNMGLVQEQKGYQSESKKSFERSNQLIGYNPSRFDEENKYKAARDKAEKQIESETNNREEESGSKIAKDVFRKRSAFKEFISFIGNGFKLREDDQEGKK